MEFDITRFMQIDNYISGKLANSKFNGLWREGRKRYLYRRWTLSR